MNFLLLLRMQSIIAALLVVCQLPSLGVALYLHEDPTPLAMSMFVGGTLTLGYLITLRAPAHLTARDGVLGVAMGWALTVFMGALPFVFSGQLGWVGAIFESASGFTTTGSSVLTDIEAWPQGLLLWRSTTQWVGGMGILLLAIAILPYLGVGGLQLMKAEVPGITKDKLTPRVAATARILWGLYLGLTLACITAYYFSGMTLLESVNHAFTTLATGGFSTKNASMGAYSPAAQWWAIFFMTAAGANFVLHYQFIIRGNVEIFKDEEFIWYMAIFFGMGIFLSWIAFEATAQGGAETALRQGFFTVSTIMTTTGYANCDWETWPIAVQLLILAIMIPGAMAGSTAGGIKIVRAVLLGKLISATVDRLLMPERVVVIKLNGRKVPQEVLDGAVAMAFMGALILVLSTVALVAMGMDIPSAYSAALTAFSNVGPGIGSVGPMDNFSQVPEVGKVLLAFLMVVGRLEIFTIFMLFLPRFWRS